MDKPQIQAPQIQTPTLKHKQAHPDAVRHSLGESDYLRREAADDAASECDGDDDWDDSDPFAGRYAGEAPNYELLDEVLSNSCGEIEAATEGITKRLEDFDLSRAGFPATEALLKRTLNELRQIERDFEEHLDPQTSKRLKAHRDRQAELNAYDPPDA